MLPGTQRAWVAVLRRSNVDALDLRANIAPRRHVEVEVIRVVTMARLEHDAEDVIPAPQDVRQACVGKRDEGGWRRGVLLVPSGAQRAPERRGAVPSAAS